MPFAHTVRTLNGFKRRKVIKDYVLIGAVAATAYMEPVFTEDLDIIVLAGTDEEYLHTFRRIAESVDALDGMHATGWYVPLGYSKFRCNPLPFSPCVGRSTHWSMASSPQSRPQPGGRNRRLVSSGQC